MSRDLPPNPNLEHLKKQLVGIGDSTCAFNFGEAGALFSRYESATLGRLVIRPEHVLLGVIRGDGRSSRDLWKTAGVTIAEARVAVVDPSEPRDEVVEPVQIPFQSATKALFTAAAGEADRLGHAKVSTAHVVLALIREESAASTFLRSRGITLEAAGAAAAMAESPLMGEDS